jgi:hypothetical protein
MVKAPGDGSLKSSGTGSGLPGGTGGSDMNERDLESAVLRALEQAASGGVGDRPIEPERPLAEQFELDAERFFNALARETGLDIPAADRVQLLSLADCLDYFADGLAG